MLISHEHRFSFVHIPKCAGTSLRGAISPLTQPEDRYWLYEDLEGVGRVDIAHMPLWFMAERFPEAYRALRDYRSYAVIRDPQARFLSSVAEHFRNFQSGRAEQMPRSRVRSKVMAIMEKLRWTRRLIDHEYIHFTPQVDFVRHEGEQIVEALYPVEEIPTLLEDLSAHVDQPLALEDAPQRSRRMSGLPPRLRRVLLFGKSALERSPLARHSARIEAAIRPYTNRLNRPLSIDWLGEEAFVRDFVAEHYAADIALHADLTDRTLAPRQSHSARA